MIPTLTITEEIHMCLIKLLIEKFNANPELLKEHNWDQPLTGSVFNFSGVELTYLFFEIENIFNIKVGPKNLQQYGFSSINKIAKVIEETIKSSEKSQKVVQK